MPRCNPWLPTLLRQKHNASWGRIWASLISLVSSNTHGSITQRDKPTNDFIGAQNYWVCPVFKKLEHNISETGCFCPHARWEKPTLLGPLERPNLNH
jgi:hypothetical protein